MKILVVTTSFPTSQGAIQLGGQFILTECLAYEQAGAEVTVVSPGVQGVPHQETFGRNIKVRRFSYFWPTRLQRIKVPGLALYQDTNLMFLLQLPLFLLCFMLTVMRYGRDVDIVHCNWTLSALVSLPLSWFCRKPILLTSRGSDIRKIPKIINTFIINNLDGMIDCFGPYPEILELKRQFSARYITLPVIVKEVPSNAKNNPTTEFGDGFKILFLCRYDQTKRDLGFGFFTLIEAISSLVPHHLISCIYVGDGPLKQLLTNTTEELGLSGVIQFAGHQDEVYSYIAAADLVLGGCALNAVAQEACLMDKPQLLPDIEMWQKNLWVDRFNCIIYQTDDPASMAEGIQFAITETAKMHMIIDQVRIMTRKYIVTGKVGGEAYLAAFSEVIHKRTAG